VTDKETVLLYDSMVFYKPLTNLMSNKNEDGRKN